MFGGSQSSSVTQSTMPLPQVSSERQSLEQPSPSSQLPSSQNSPGSTKPLPQYISWHKGEHLASSSGGSQASSASQSIMPLPQLSSLRQSLEQPSPPSLLPSSQASPSSSTPSPQLAPMNLQLLPHWGSVSMFGGSQSSSVTQSTIPLPQVSSDRQSLEQPSPSSQLPSSQTSPGSTKPLPQYISWHKGEHLASSSGGSQASSASQSIMPLPQLSSLRQSLEQPSPPSLLPSSQASPSSSTPSPQLAPMNLQLLPHWGSVSMFGGSQSSSVTQSTIPLPQVSSDRQSLEQPSPSSQLPSSQTSPLSSSTMRLPQ